jgi:hypothetical protein
MNHHGEPRTAHSVQGTGQVDHDAVDSGRTNAVELVRRQTRATRQAGLTPRHRETDTKAHRVPVELAVESGRMFFVVDLATLPGGGRRG